MNKERRGRIGKVIEQLNDLQTEITDIQEQEQEAHDNLPESLADGDRGAAMEENTDRLEEASASLQEAIDGLEAIG
jgi:predicted  nucleic acid-binding Zn-ribbon protein